MSSPDDHEWVREFIELYHAETCLWRQKDQAYADTAQRNEAYRKLIRKFNEVEPQADKESVLRKINTLRCAYKEELQKVLATKSELTGIETYKPELWYFPLMRFLDEEETVNGSMDADTDENERASCSGATSSSAKRDPADMSEDDTLDLEHEDDFHDLFGKMVAMKFKKMSEDQRLLAQEMVDDILQKAKRGELTKDHGLFDGKEVIREKNTDEGAIQNSDLASSSFHSLSLNKQQENSDDVEMREDD